MEELTLNFEHECGRVDTLVFELPAALMLRFEWWLQTQGVDRV